MKVKRVIVDEMPPDCTECELFMESYAGWCKAEGICIEDSTTRPSWCPLELETDVETDVQTVQQAPHTEKSSEETCKNLSIYQKS